MTDDQRLLDILAHQKMLVDAYQNFQDKRYALPASSHSHLHSYDFANTFGRTSFGSGLTSSGIVDDLRELINNINAWTGQLNSWAAWNQVIAGYGEKEAWYLRTEFIETIAYFCMFQPSGIRDRLVRCASFAMHQGNMAIDPKYPDKLAEDEAVYRRLDKGHPRPYDVFLSRNATVIQADKLAKNWMTAKPFLDLVKYLDDQAYKDATSDYRNKASHAIPPHFEFGETSFVTRQVSYANKKIDHLSGGISFIEDRTRKAVSYSFGGVRALSLSEMYEANHRQYVLAKQVLLTYESLLQEMLGVIGEKTKSETLKKSVGSSNA